MDPVEWMFQVWRWNALCSFYHMCDNPEKYADAENEIDNLFAGLQPGFSVSDADKKKAFAKLCDFFDNAGPFFGISGSIRWYLYPIDEEGMQALAWLSGRYDSAAAMEMLGTYFGGEEYDLYRCPVMMLTDLDIDEIYLATEGDGGNPGTMPCAGGSLLQAWNYFQSKRV